MSAEDGRYTVRARGRTADRIARYIEDSGAPTDNAAVMALIVKGLDAHDIERAARVVRPEQTEP